MPADFSKIKNHASLGTFCVSAFNLKVSMEYQVTVCIKNWIYLRRYTKWGTFLGHVIFLCLKVTFILI
jgi:hypothetical protein